MTTTVRILKPGDEKILEKVIPGVFDNEVNPALAAAYLNEPRNHLAVAIDNDKVIGMASAIDHIHPDKPVTLWINEMGVAPPYQRKGIGLQLLQALFALARELGCDNAWVGTEHDNAPACGLYAKAGGHSSPFVMYAFHLTNSLNEIKNKDPD